MANYTTKAIFQNFEQMLAEMPFDKITVSALVARCEISSNTFYYHFRDIYDLLDAWLVEQKKAYLAAVGNSADWPAHLKRILHMLKDRAPIVYHIFDSISRERLERFVFVVLEKEFYAVVKENLGDRSVSDAALQDLASFCCYSTFGFFIKFLFDHMAVDIDEAVDRLSKIFYGVVAYVAERDGDGAPHLAPERG